MISKNDLKEISEELKKLLGAFNFLLFNKYTDLEEKELQDLYGEIGSYILNILTAICYFITSKKEFKELLIKILNEEKKLEE